MHMDNLFIEFCEKIKTKSRSLPQFLAPFIGILVNLYRAIHEMQENMIDLKNNFDNLATLFNRMDSFDPTLFKSCYKQVITELPPQNETEIIFFKCFESMLLEIDILV